jgi:hypothetical protein
MANSFRKPWIIDTAGAGAICANRMFATALVFSGYTAATDKCIIKDTVRNIVVLTFDGNADLSPVEVQGDISINAPAVTTLTTGILTIWVE